MGEVQERRVTGCISGIAIHDIQMIERIMVGWLNKRHDEAAGASQIAVHVTRNWNSVY